MNRKTELLDYLTILFVQGIITEEEDLKFRQRIKEQGKSFIVEWEQ